MRKVRLLVSLVFQVFMATIFPLILGVGTISLLPDTGRHAWLDAPYGLPFWGSALALGIVINRLVPTNLARWIWLLGALCFSLLAAIDLHNYNGSAFGCLGCSRTEFVLRNYFAYPNCLQECLGELIATTPLLNSIAYSVGAAIGIAMNRRQQDETVVRAQRR